MGDVYRARDTKLGREVAIKVLPEEFTADAERLARFEREARVLASLNHPNISQNHGLEEDDGQRFLVLEFVEGETLAERIARGRISIERALPIALQVVRALEAAHGRGIVHRDVKPANVMLTEDGDAKVLDFGIAKPVVAAGEGTRTRTLTRPPTRPGVLMGTPAYMSPEQLRGETVDKRTDIWAFGVTLWEMLTGARLFEGGTDSDTVAAVLRASPNFKVLPAETPPAVRRVLRRCLERDPDERLHDMADARLEIEEAIAEPTSLLAGETASPQLRFWQIARAAWPVLLAGVVLGLLATVLGWRYVRVMPPAPRGTQRVALTLPKGVTFPVVDRPNLAISPDGRWLVFGAKEGDTWRLYRRSLAQFDATPIPGTEDGFHPFFSPDGDWVGFSSFSDGKLKKIPLAGGPPQTLADAPGPYGATWGPDGSIVFNPKETDGLWRVAATGGASEQLASPQFEQGDWNNLWPEYLPDGKAVLFTNFWGMTADTARIEVLDLETRARKTVIENASYARYVPTGHLIFGRGDHIEVAPFDLERREVTGPSVPVPEPIFYDFENGVPHLAVSAGGTLAFIPGGGAARRQLVSVDLEGRERPLIEARRGFMYPRYSPDGERLAITISEPGDTNVWVLDLRTGTQTKLTLEGTNAFPLWTPDGERVTYLSVRGGGAFSIDWKRADGHGEGEPLILTKKTDEDIWPYSWSPDGETLVYGWELRSQPEDWGDIWMAARDGDPEPRPFVATGAYEWGASISPDGHWLAYVSGEPGRTEIFVQPFPDGGERHQISTDGGFNPVWSPNGRSIYYVWGYQLLAVSVATEPRFRAGAAQVLLEGEYEVGTYVNIRNFDIAPDGKSFVMVKPDEEWGTATEVRVVLNWFEELKRLAPEKIR
jgi:serine/threonine-protein kinase